MSDSPEEAGVAEPSLPPFERENSLEELEGESGLADEDPDASLTPGLDDSLANDDPLPTNAYDEAEGEEGNDVESTLNGTDTSLVADTGTIQDSATEGAVGTTNDPPQPDGPIDEFPPDNTPDVTVTLVILPENFAHVLNVKAACTGHDLKEKVVSELPLPYDALSLKLNDEDFPDDIALLDVGVKPGSPCEMELVVKFTAEEVIEDEKDDEPKQLPEYIEVEVEDSNSGGKRILTVIIDSSRSEKPRYQGGYKDTRDGTKYHHASTQTQSQKKKEYVEKFTTETQTFELRTRKAQTQREMATQMTRTDVLLDDENDVHVRTGRYVTADETLNVKAAKVVTLQRFVRGMRDRKRRDFLRVKRDNEIAIAKEALEAAQAREIHRRHFAIERRVRPGTASDFALLRSEFEQWRVKEMQVIDSIYPAVVDDGGVQESKPIAENERRRKLGANLYATANPVTLASDTKDAMHASNARKQAMAALLAKETKMLRAIEKLKKRANELNQQEMIKNALDDMSTSKNWEKKDGAVVVVDTTEVIRARELKALYDACVLDGLGIDERLEVLNHVKWTVKEFSDKLSKEICELIDRESDLLVRGRDVRTMAGLRKRIANLFLTFIQTPAYNPEAFRYSVQALAEAEREAEREEQQAARAERIRQSERSRGVY